MQARNALLLSPPVQNPRFGTGHHGHSSRSASSPVSRIGDISNFGSGNIGFGMGSSTLARVGDQQVTEREMSEAMQRRLQEVRASEKPDADYATIAGDFETILERADRPARADRLRRQISVFPCRSGWSMPKSRRSRGTKGLNGKFSDQAYQQFLAQQRLTDAEVRQIIAGGLLQRLLLTPVATNARVSVGMASPYASMLLESREGEAAAVPVDAFRAGLKPTDADLQRYYAANRNRYMVPEQRVLRIARIGPEQVAGVTASDQEIAAYYNANAGDLRREGNASAQPGGGARPGERERHRRASVKAGATLRRAAAGGQVRRSPRSRTRPARLMPGSPATRRRRRCSARRPARSSGRSSRTSAGSSPRSIRSGRRAASRSPRRAPKSPPSSTSTSASKRSRTSSTRSRTPSTKATISPKPRPPPKSR